MTWTLFWQLLILLTWVPLWWVAIIRGTSRKPDPTPKTSTTVVVNDTSDNLARARARKATMPRGGV